MAWYGMSAFCVAIGTQRGAAEEWLKQLDKKYPGLQIEMVSPSSLPAMRGVTASNEEWKDVAVLEEPCSNLEEFRAIVQAVFAKGWQVYLQYFPGEPLITLIQKDQSAPVLLGADVLRKELQQLQPVQKYLEILEISDRNC